jgi:hypothetical protein
MSSRAGRGQYATTGHMPSRQRAHENTPTKRSIPSAAAADGRSIRDGGEGRTTAPRAAVRRANGGRSFAATSGSDSHASRVRGSVSTSQLLATGSSSRSRNLREHAQTTTLTPEAFYSSPPTSSTSVYPSAQHQALQHHLALHAPTSPSSHSASSHPHPHQHSVRDFVVVGEFGEVVGPRPVRVLPNLDACGNFDLERFLLQAMSSDYQSAIDNTPVPPPSPPSATASVGSRASKARKTRRTRNKPTTEKKNTHQRKSDLHTQRRTANASASADDCSPVTPCTVRREDERTSDGSPWPAGDGCGDAPNFNNDDAREPGESVAAQRASAPDWENDSESESEESEMAESDEEEEQSQSPSRPPLLAATDAQVVLPIPSEDAHAYVRGLCTSEHFSRSLSLCLCLSVSLFVCLFFYFCLFPFLSCFWLFPSFS